MSVVKAINVQFLRAVHFSGCSALMVTTEHQCTVVCYTILECIVMHYTALQYTSLQYCVMQCTVLQYTSLHYSRVHVHVCRSRAIINTIVVLLVWPPQLPLLYPVLCTLFSVLTTLYSLLYYCTCTHYCAHYYTYCIHYCTHHGVQHCTLYSLLCEPLYSLLYCVNH